MGTQVDSDEGDGQITVHKNRGQRICARSYMLALLTAFCEPDLWYSMIGLPLPSFTELNHKHELPCVPMMKP